MARQWTNAQLSAINTRGRTLLISAAAGSGKTATLTERIIRRITDPIHPVELSRLLIVTFTKAAATELKQRISTALSEAIAADPGNAHLQKQLLHLGSAHISTIDAFCYQPVKAYFAEAGMPASFRIAVDAELLPLKERIMGEIIDEMYQKYRREQEEDGLFSILYDNPFADLCDSLTPFKNDENLPNLLFSLYNELLNFPEGIERLNLQAERLRVFAEREFFESDHGKLLKEWTQCFVDASLSFYRSALEEIEDDPAAIKAYGPALQDEYQFFARLQRALDVGEYDRTRLIIHAYVAQDFKSCRNPANDYTDLKKRRTKCLKDLDEFRISHYASTTEVLHRDMLHLSRSCGVLYDLLHTFDERMLEEKKARDICDFTDNRRRLLTMLRNSDGSPTELCQTFQGDYDEVYIDEYQDVDEVQDTIFRLIGGDHRFMVGDIKQSIYGFRGADPSVFSNYRKSLPSLELGEADGGNSIFMSDNFRCDESVIRVTNGICSHIFSTCPDSINYLPEDDLGFSKKCPEGYVSPKVHIAMISATPKNQPKGQFSGSEAEAAYVAGEISRLLNNRVTLADGSVIRPKDIAILMRDNLQLFTYTAALAALGIPTGCDEIEAAQAAKDLLHGSDMICLINLLRVINNPDNDIALAEILRCPFPGLSLDQLITLRQSSQSRASLYEALESYLNLETVDPDIHARVSAFVSWIESYRSLSKTLRADELLKLLQNDERVSCRKTKAFLYLYEHARTCHVSPFTGLYTFLKYLEQLLLTEKNVKAEGVATDPGGAVSLMTIHHSKGLEFPVCFVVRCGNAKKNKLAGADLVFEKSSGVAMKFYDRSSHAKFDNGLRKITALARFNQDKEEEMRVLYVAMTRARERLYLVGSSVEARAPFRHGDRFNALTSLTYMEWIKAGLEAHPEILPYCDIREIKEADIELGEPYVRPSSPDVADTSGGVDTYYRHLQSLSTPPTPFEEMIRSVPTAVPASRMTDKLLDECVFYQSNLPVGDEDKLPASERGGVTFDAQSLGNIENALRLMGNRDTPDEFELFLKSNTRPTAAEKGTAMHLFLQYCDWHRVLAGGAEVEISRLCEEGFITPRVAEILDRKQIAAFFASRFLQRVKDAPSATRELKFQRFVPLEKLTSDPDLGEALQGRSLYVRGSIDLLCEFEDGHLEICDYKTDRLSKEEREDPALLEKHLKEKHGSQLKQYAAALEELYGKKPEKVFIFSLPLGEAVEISLD